jgi:hypothetical protein
MKRPKWLSGWGKGENILESSLLIDAADMKVVQASYDNKPLFFAVGTPRETENFSALEDGETETDKARNLKWKIFYDTTILPQLMPPEKVKNLMLGIVSASAKTTSVYDTDTVYVASGERPSKGNAPLLIDYDIAAKIDEAKKKKTKSNHGALSPEQE